MEDPGKHQTQPQIKGKNSNFKHAESHFCLWAAPITKYQSQLWNSVLVTHWTGWRKPEEAVWCLTPQVLSNAQSQAIFGPLNNARVVEDNAGQDHPLAPHHRLVCRLLREPRRTQWRNWREIGRRNRDKLGTFSFLLRNTLQPGYCKKKKIPPPTTDGAYYSICGFMVNWLKTAFPQPKWNAIDSHLWSHAGSRPLTKRRAARRGGWNDKGVKKEEMRIKKKNERMKERKKDGDELVNADSGEHIREIKRATSATGSLSLPYTALFFFLLTFISSKTLRPSLQSFSFSSFLSMSHLPGFYSQTLKNYSGCHCLRDSLGPACSSPPRQIDQQHAGPAKRLCDVRE